MTAIHSPPLAGRPLTGRKVLAIALGAFAVVAAVNAVFVVLALGSWTGLERRNAYLEGLDYNRTLARAEAQRALGWRLDWQLQAADGGQVLELRLRDADDRPVTGVEVKAEWRRPTPRWGAFGGESPATTEGLKSVWLMSPCLAHSPATRPGLPPRGPMAHSSLRICRLAGTTSMCRPRAV